MARKKIAKIQTKKAPSTTLQKLCEEKNKHLTIPYNHYAKKMNIYNFKSKMHITLPYKNYANKKKCTNLIQKST